MSAGFNLAEKEPFPEVFDTVWTDSKRGGVEFMRIGETEGILHARSPLRSCTFFHLLWPVCGKTFTFSN
ncbi:hypothetical protein XZ45_13650 [Salmonella enterica subsp. enterica]|nr:hypothetical protein [Salmonella enterica subsp. enterica serovar Aba]EAA5377105.1 hypothetical protein [Salmonella enterica subsp. enterica serovar Canada]EAP9251642.1 hypothetical protein [Salmonella enterica]EBX7378402.1 hypothetical protein [Salmonella enterica subsp. enterica serovar Takoradi]ECI2857242.1 hypothetical protein [Salmonella enterica subsp. enterica]